MDNLGQRKIAFWSIDTQIFSFGVADALSMPSEATAAAATMRTGLNLFSGVEITILPKAGYAGADASIRASY
jgi:NTE family protein